MVILTHGRVIASGQPAELMSDAGVDTLEELFVDVTGLAERMAGKQQELRQITFFEAPSGFVAHAPERNR